MTNGYFPWPDSYASESYRVRRLAVGRDAKRTTVCERATRADDSGILEERVGDLPAVPRAKRCSRTRARAHASWRGG